MRSADLVRIGFTLLVALGAVRAGRSWWRHRGCGRAAFLVAFLALFVARVVTSPHVHEWIDRTCGYPNVCRLALRLSEVLLAACIQVLVLSWTDRDARIRRVVAGYVLVAIVVAALFLAGPVAPERATHTGLSRETDGRLLADLGCTLVALAAAQLNLLRLSRRLVGVPGPWLRRGLRLVEVSAALGLVYCAVAMAVEAGLPWPRVVDGQRLAEAVATAMESALILGVVLPAWGPRLFAGWTWWSYVREYRALGPLWSDLRAPGRGPAHGPVLAPARSWRPDDAEHRLYRRMIEIRDAQLALRPYVDPGLVAAVRRNLPQDGPGRFLPGPLVEAVVLHGALVARSRGQAPGDGAPSDEPAGPEGFAAERVWLVEVARVWREIRSGGDPERPDAGRAGPPGSGHHLARA
ncbi:MAG: hypothetical protein IPK24_23760 [Kineosporiaceae bacterium]|nr:hypothetical protein [Kineosporiaceae bacterium]